MATLQELQQIISPEVRVGVSLASFTTYRFGGPAEFFFEATTADDAVRAVRAAAELELPLTVLGGGSNVLVADDGVKGLVLRLADRRVRIEGEKVIAGAGAPPGNIALRSVEAGLAGFEWAAGLPGTIGGAVRGNAGMFGGEMKDSVESVRVLDGSEAKILANADLAFGYRDSLFKKRRDLVILEVMMKLRPGSGVEAGKALMRRNLEEKRLKQPLEHYSAGCVFKNWKPESPEQLETLRKALDLNKDEKIPLTPLGTVPAGWIIDRAQLKGYRVGHSWVSEKHGNFLLNDGCGTASEMIALIAAIKMKVRDMTHGIVNFEEEIEYVGF